MDRQGLLSVQLYSVRDALAENQDRTLARLAEIGFRYVEPFGLGSADKSAAERLVAAKALRRGLDAAGLRVSATHAGLPDDVGSLAEECAEIGADTVFVPHPRMVDGFDADVFGDPGRLAAFADAVNAAGQALAGAGLRLGYHNHDFEWAPLPDGRSGYDAFWASADDAILAELDVYWATVAGASPVEVLTRLGARAVSVHLKDGPARRGEPQTPLGTGDVDAPAAVRAAGPGLRWHVAEIDITDHDPFELLAGNAAQLAASGLSRWA